MGGAIVGNVLAQHGAAAWIAPTYKNTRPLWRWLLQATAMDVKAGRMQVSKAERSVSTHMGGFLGLYSGDNIDSVRGEAFHLVVIDEAARIAEDAWADAILPTLADYDGDAILISTPKGKNWFWREWSLGKQGGEYSASWTAPTSANPDRNIQRAFRLARERVTERSFRQEWLAEFLEGGEVFRRIQDAATATEQERAIDGHHYVIGVDWGKLNDFTVLTVIDGTLGAMAYMDRFNQIDYAVQLGRLKALCERFRPAMVLAERNSMGEPLVEQLQRDGLPVQPFQTTNASKAQAIDALTLAFERGDLAILPDPVLISELQAYEADQLPSGLTRYGAPEGMHDDCVMSLALAWHGAAQDTRLLMW